MLRTDNRPHGRPSAPVLAWLFSAARSAYSALHFRRSQGSFGDDAVNADGGQQNRCNRKDREHEQRETRFGRCALEGVTNGTITNAESRAAGTDRGSIT